MVAIAECLYLVAWCLGGAAHGHESRESRRTSKSDKDKREGQIEVRQTRTARSRQVKLDSKLEIGCRCKDLLTVLDARPFPSTLDKYITTVSLSRRGLAGSS